MATLKCGRKMTIGVKLEVNVNKCVKNVLLYWFETIAAGTTKNIIHL